MAEGERPVEAKKFGTFLGVFTPSVLTILGVMMYLRFGWVLGNAGLLHTLLILCMASGITFITGLSASAIATNIRVGVGGEYYMVSRSLVRLANGFNQERGIVTVCQAVVGRLEEDYGQIPAMRREMEEAMEKEGLAAFCEVNIVRNFEEGVINITQANGYAGLQSNTIMFGWPDNAEGMARLLRICSVASRLNISCLLARLEDTETVRPKQTLDVWWRGKQYNGDMMLLLGHLLTLNTDWKDGKIRLRTIVPNKQGEKESVTEALNELVQEVRIPADIDVFTMNESTHLFDLMQSHSRDADLVFMGLKIPEEIELFEYADTLFKLGNRFDNVVFVHNAGKFAGQLI